MKKHLALVNLLALILSALVHLLSYTEFMPQTIDVVRESRPLVFLPDSISSTTWLIIYFGLLIFAVYQSQYKSQDIVDRASWYFLFTCIGRITGTILYIYGDVWMSTLARVMTLAALIMIYERLNLRFMSVKHKDFWLMRFPFSVFLGWASVTTVVNVATALYDYGYQSSFLGITADMWTVIMLGFLIGLALLLLFTLNDFAFALTIAWGALTIFLRSFNTELYNGLQHMQFGLVDVVAFSAFALLVLVVGVQAILNWNKNQKLVLA